MRGPLSALLVAAASFAVVTGAIVGVGLAMAEPAHAQIIGEVSGRSLSAAWKGVYVPSDGGPPNQFDATLSQNGTALTGTIIEPNSFADQALALFLTSNVRGTVAGDKVQFVKTYDGTAGVSHAVSYTGELDATGRHIRGTYTLEGGAGAFEMAR